MPVILHRPEKGESEHCLVGGTDLYMYIGGPITGTENFQNDIADCLSDIVPKDRVLHIANPRWTDISRKAKLSVSERRNWNITHRNIAAHAGRRGLFLYYAAAINKSAIPAYSKQVFDHAAETELTLLAATSQLAELGTPVLLGIDETRPLDGMQGMLEHAKENDIPVYDGIEEACAAAAALLLQPPTL